MKPLKMEFSKLSYWLTLTAFCCIFMTQPLLAQDLSVEIQQAQNAIDQADSQDDSILAMLEYARLLLEAEKFEEALDALYDPAQLLKVPPSAEIRLENLVVNNEAIRTILLYRGLAEESVGQYAEARADYLAFIKLDTESETAVEILGRLKAIDADATQALAQLALQDESQLNRFFDYKASQYAVGIVPFYNASEQIQLNQVGYGLAGFLSNAVLLLRDYSDKPFRLVERSRLRAAMDEVQIGRFYAADAPLAPPQLGQLLGAEFLVMGKLETQDQSIVVAPQMASTEIGESQMFSDQIADLSNKGIQQMQIDLALALADQLQLKTGFEFIPSRAAYRDTLQSLIIDDLQSFLAYGHGIELSISGDLDAADQAFADANVSVATIDRIALTQARAGAGSGSASSSVASITQTPYVGSTDIPVTDGNTVDPAQTPVAPGLLLDMGDALLGSVGVGDAIVGAGGGRNENTRGKGDPTDGTTGTLGTRLGRTKARNFLPLPTPPNPNDNRR